jgi:HD-like signal output (HDOD) protein
MPLDALSLVRDAGPLASLPAVHSRLSEALADPLASATAIAAIIAEDAGLAARLLRLVNSPFYSFARPIDTVSRAVVLVGTRQIGDLALATCIMRMFHGIPTHFVDMEAFWLHGLATGVAARVIAMRRGETHVESLFVAGVLHDVGRLLIYRAVPDLAREMLRSRREGELLVEVERELLGFDHADVGGVLLSAWKLPERLQAAVACHHRPESDTRASRESATVHVADIVAHALEVGTSGERLVPPLEPAAWEQLDLPASALASVVDQTERQLGAAMALVGAAARS